MDIKLNAATAKDLLDDSAVDRIIAAVCEKGAMPDRDTVRNDLLTCYGRYSIASGPGQPGFIKASKRAAEFNSKARLKAHGAVEG